MELKIITNKEENHMQINGKWYTEPQLAAYVKELEGELKEIRFPVWTVEGQEFIKKMIRKRK